MTSTFSYDSSENQIFILSALGSLLIHGALISLLAFLPRTPPIEDSTPTIQVKLVETQLETQDNSSIQPLSPAHSIPPPPSPTQTRKTIQPSPAAPIQPSLASPTSLAQAPSPSLTPTQPILNDTRAAQAMKARDLMKMTAPIQAAQVPQSLPPARSHKKYSNPAMLSSSSITRQQKNVQTPPLLPQVSTSQSLTARPPVSTGSSTTKAKIVSSSKPVYPRVARESGWEGIVVIRTLINTKGVAEQVKIRKSSGHAVLDRSAQEAVKTWKFQPEKDGNIPLAKWVDIPIKFDLNS